MDFDTAKIAENFYSQREDNIKTKIVVAAQTSLLRMKALATGTEERAQLLAAVQLELRALESFNEGLRCIDNGLAALNSDDDDVENATAWTTAAESYHFAIYHFHNAAIRQREGDGVTAQQINNTAEATLEAARAAGSQVTGCYILK